MCYVQKVEAAATLIWFKKQITFFQRYSFGEFKSKFVYLLSQFVIYVLKMSTADRQTTNIEPRDKLTDTD